MTADIESLVLEQLRHIRTRVDQIAANMNDMTSLEVGMSLIKREIAYGEEINARHQLAIDKLTTRIEHIERRLELRDN